MAGQRLSTEYAGDEKGLGAVPQGCSRLHGYHAQFNVKQRTLETLVDCEEKVKSLSVALKNKIIHFLFNSSCKTPCFCTTGEDATSLWSILPFVYA